MVVKLLIYKNERPVALANLLPKQPAFRSGTVIAYRALEGHGGKTKDRREQ
jgi:hypothetical protein